MTDARHGPQMDETNRRARKTRAGFSASAPKLSRRQSNGSLFTTPQREQPFRPFRWMQANRRKFIEMTLQRYQLHENETWPYATRTRGSVCWSWSVRRPQGSACASGLGSGLVMAPTVCYLFIFHHVISESRLRPTAASGIVHVLLRGLVTWAVSS